MRWCAAYNWGLLLRKVWGINKPRHGDTARSGPLWAFAARLIMTALVAPGVGRKVAVVWGLVILTHLLAATLSTLAAAQQVGAKNVIFLTGC